MSAMNLSKSLTITGLIVLASCTKPLNPIDLAKDCIRKQVPEGKNLSTIKAQEVLAHCNSSLDAWSRYSVEGTPEKQFNGRNPAMMANFWKHRQELQKYWLNQLSTEYADAHPKYD
jgi:hypothetical protein